MTQSAGHKQIVGRRTSQCVNLPMHGPGNRLLASGLMMLAGGDDASCRLADSQPRPAISDPAGDLGLTRGSAGFHKFDASRGLEGYFEARVGLDPGLEFGRVAGAELVPGNNKKSTQNQSCGGRSK